MATTSSRPPRVTVTFTPEEIGAIQGRSKRQPSAYLKELALADIGSDDPTCRQFYALGAILNEALGVLVDEAAGQVPDKFIHQLSALRDAMRVLQRQAVMEQRISIQEILQQLHEAVGENKLSPLAESNS
ncbi:MAG: hypothetical protein F6K00_33730 [Leptolyngbya sp. SIOISBB]|nr:hypothetical protein [Leptolyngbya sp. SIOISBB]